MNQEITRRIQEAEQYLARHIDNGPIDRAGLAWSNIKDSVRAPFDPHSASDVVELAAYENLGTLQLICEILHVEVRAALALVGQHVLRPEDYRQKRWAEDVVRECQLHFESAQAASAYEYETNIGPVLTSMTVLPYQERKAREEVARERLKELLKKATDQR